MGLEELSDQIGNWMVTGKFDEHRCLYENEDILVTHNVATFENGSREAIYNLTLKKRWATLACRNGCNPS
jgi:hypothetical protein